MTDKTEKVFGYYFSRENSNRVQFQEKSKFPIKEEDDAVMTRLMVRLGISWLRKR